MEKIIEDVREGVVKNENIDEYIEQNKQYLLTDITKIDSVCDMFLEKDKFDLVQKIIDKNMEELQKITKKMQKKIQKIKRKEVKDGEKLDLQNEWLESIEPKLTRSVYSKLSRARVNSLHSFFGTTHILCKNNIIYHFKYNHSDEEWEKNTEFSNIHCRDVTNNYIQICYNDETKNLTFLVPCQQYFQEVFQHGADENKDYVFVPVYIHSKGKSVGHACFFIIHLSTKESFYFDPNGTCQPSNDFMDSCMKTISTDYGYQYKTINTWNPSCKYLQFASEHRESWNKGDCVILSIQFAHLLNKKHTVPRTLINELYEMDEKERKTELNQFYLEFVNYIPERTMRKKKTEGESS